jgi:hypothetical protein
MEPWPCCVCLQSQWPEHLESSWSSIMVWARCHNALWGKAPHQRYPENLLRVADRNRIYTLFGRRSSQVPRLIENLRLNIRNAFRQDDQTCKIINPNLIIHSHITSIITTTFADGEIINVCITNLTKESPWCRISTLGLFTCIASIYFDISTLAFFVFSIRFTENL